MNIKKSYLYLLLSLLLMGCETYRTVSELENRYVGKEVYSTGEGTCFVRVPTYVKEISLTCPRDLNEAYIITSANYQPISQNDLFEAKFYYLTAQKKSTDSEEINIVVPLESLISKSLPQGLLTENSINAEKKE